MYRVFCATPSDSQADLEDERNAFHEVVGELNEAEGMPEGILFVPVSVLPHLTSLIAFEQSVDENVRACMFFVQVLHHTWGPPTRNFEHQYQLATQCCKGVSVFFKARSGLQIEPAVANFRESQNPMVDFHSLDDFRTALRPQLADWLKLAKDS